MEQKSTDASTDGTLLGLQLGRTSTAARPRVRLANSADRASYLDVLQCGHYKNPHCVFVRSGIPIEIEKIRHIEGPRFEHALNDEKVFCLVAELPAFEVNGVMQEDWIIVGAAWWEIKDYGGGEDGSPLYLTALCEDDTQQSRRELFNAEIAAAIANHNLVEIWTEKWLVLRNLAVDVEYERRGVATALVQWGMQQAREEGRAALTLANDLIRPLLLKFGFEVIEGLEVRDGEERVEAWIVGCKML